MTIFNRAVLAVCLASFLFLGNSLYLKATNEVTFKYKQARAKKIKVYGSFNGWAKGYKLKKVSKDSWQQTVELARGRHEYKFLVDGKWKYDAKRPAINDGLFSKNNVIIVR